MAHIKKSMVVEEADAGGFHNAFDEFDNHIEAEGNWINFRFFDRRGAPTATEARWMLTSAEREQIRRARVLRASATTPARRCATPVRRARARCSHRVVRAVRVTKTAAGDSGDPDPEPPTTRHTATIGGVP